MKNILKKVAGIAVVAVLALLMFGCSNEVVSHTHTFGTWTSNNDATKNADGTKYRTCSDCSYKETVTDEGTKLPKEVGDFILKDGTVLSKDETPEKGSVAAVIVRAATNDKPALGVGIKHDYSGLEWCKPYTDTTRTTRVAGYDKNISALQGNKDKGYMDGSDGWEILKAACDDAEQHPEYYPAWNFCLTYAAKNGLTGELAEGWYLPTVAELYTIYLNKETVDASLSKSGNRVFGTGQYSSCCQYSVTATDATALDFSNGTYQSVKKILGSNIVCSVRAFN